MKLINNPVNLFDIMVKHNDAKIYIDHLSMPRIVEMTIDFEKLEYLQGYIDGRFKYIPNKKFYKTCKCGITFKSVDKKTKIV